MAHEHHALAIQGQAQLRNALARLLVPLPTLRGSLPQPCVTGDAKPIQTLNHLLRQISPFYRLSIFQAIVAAIPILARRQATAAVSS
eukprot:229801-Pleurochrysis_carterae.AAC.1